MTSTHLTIGQQKIAAAQRPEAHHYWKNLLHGANASTFRPDIHETHRSVTNQISATYQLDEGLVNRLKSGCHNDSGALCLVLSTAVAALLRAYTGDDDILIYTPSTIGGAVVPMRLELQVEDTFRSLLGRVQEAASAAHPHLDFPIDLVGPAPKVMVALSDLHQVDAQNTYCGEFVFMFLNSTKGLLLEVYADNARYSDDTVYRIGQHFIRLLEKAIVNPSIPFVDLDLLLESDLAMLRSINHTAHDYPNVPLTELFSRTFNEFPNKIAVYTAHSNYTFADLDAASTRIARTLIHAGVSLNQTVGIFSERSFAMLSAIVGVMKAGAAYLPLDPGLPSSRIDYLLNDSATLIVLAQDNLIHKIQGEVNIISLEVDVTTPIEPGIAMPVVLPSDAAYVIYTSGSTGLPKGVIVEHHSVVNRLKWMQRAYPIDTNDVILQKTPISFDVSVWELFWWLIEGASVSLLEPGGEREPAAVVAAIERCQITTMHFVPTMLSAFLEYVALTNSVGRLSSLHRVFASGEALGVHQVRLFADNFPNNVELVNLYGPTEATVDVTHHVTSPIQSIVPIGKPIDNIHLYVLDSNMKQRPIGMLGELFIAGVGLARGYLNRPALTDERFVSGEAVGETRLYRTGDLVRWLADGSLEYFGRNDFQVKLRGFRIELGEIEHCLRAHEIIHDSVVIMRKTDDQQQHLFAYVIASQPINEQALLEYLDKALPAYMVPERITQVDSFPLSPNGKLDHKALPNPSRTRSTYVAPRTHAEKILADVWAEALGLKQVGVTESFFSLGGNSIHFVSVLAKARKHGLNFTFQKLFQHPTIESLVEHADDTALGDIQPREFGRFELLSNEDRAKIPPGIEDAYPMSMMQSGMIYQSEIMEGNSSYHDIVSYLIRGSINTDVFREAFQLYVNQNPVFRTSYQLKDYSDYIQLVHERIDDLPLFVEDIRHLQSDAEHEVWYADWFREEQNYPFIWDKPGLVRLHIHILRDDLYRYSISQHNSALDGWSKMQVHTALFDMYYAMLQGETIKVEAVENHFRNFVGLERYSAQSEAHMNFWQKTLIDRPNTKIPRLRPENSDKGLEVVFQNIEISSELSDQIVALAERLSVPVKCVLLAAHLKFHTVVCGEDDILTGYEQAGRPELLGADQALGVFTNSLPLRVNVNDGTWIDLIKQAYNVEANILPYRRYPMAKIKQDCRTTNVLFETVFNFVHFYSLKALKKHPEFSLEDVRAGAITEFPLRVEFSRHFYTDKVEFILQYQTAIFDPEHVIRLGGYIVRALEKMVAEPDMLHNAGSLLSDQELNELAQYKHDQSNGISIMDRSGNLAPIGTIGGVIKTSESGVESVEAGLGRWLPGGVLQMADSEKPNETVSVSEVKTDHKHSNIDLSVAVRRVAQVWSEVLKIPVDDIHTEDDFFEIGGNSLAALKVVLLLDGEISLRDMMRYSRLYELAAAAKIVPAIREEKEQLLVKLSDNSEHVTSSIVCLPYAGGNAVHFGPFADAMSQYAKHIAVYSVELPGHDPEAKNTELKSFAITSKLIADEIEQTIRGPVYLWGHCVGTAMAIEVTRLLVERGIQVNHLFLAAKLLISPEEMRTNLSDADQVSFTEIREFFEQWNGVEVLEGMGDKYEEFLARVFRHDSIESNRYLLASSESSTWEPLNIPCTFVIADDDSCTAGYERDYLSWHQLIVDIQLRKIYGGGHFFMRTESQQVAELVYGIVNYCEESKCIEA